MRARTALDSDDPTVENIQVSLLLSVAYFQSGKGKKAYMILCESCAHALRTTLLTLLQLVPSAWPSRLAFIENFRRRYVFHQLKERDEGNCSGHAI